MGTPIADQDEQIDKIAQDTGAPADLVRVQYMETLRTLAATHDLCTKIAQVRLNVPHS